MERAPLAFSRRTVASVAACLGVLGAWLLVGFAGDAAVRRRNRPAVESPPGPRRRGQCSGAAVRRWRSLAERWSRLQALTASWRSVAGCGAGSSTGVGGIKWVGRNVTGGLVNVQCQANYTRLATATSTRSRTRSLPTWASAGTSGWWSPTSTSTWTIPSACASTCPTRAWATSTPGHPALRADRRHHRHRLGRGFPPATTRPNTSNYLKQDRQLGSGKPSGALLVDHVLDNLWGPAVLGGTLVYPGAATSSRTTGPPRAPCTATGLPARSAGPVAGAVGDGYRGADRDRGLASDDRPPWMVSANASLEWSTDWVALLVGASLPYHTSGLQPWTPASALRSPLLV